MKNYLKMLEFLKGHEGRFGVAIIFIILSSMFEGVQLSFILPVVDRIFENKPIIIPNKVPAFLAHMVDKLNSMDVHTLFWMTPLCFMILFSIKQVVLFFSDYLMNDIAQAVMRDVRSRLFERIQTLSLDYFSRKRTGELVSRITNDVGTIENAISYAVTDIIQTAVFDPGFYGHFFHDQYQGHIVRAFVVSFDRLAHGVDQQEITQNRQKYPGKNGGYQFAFDGNDIRCAHP